MPRTILLSFVLAVFAAARADAQCPDGTPPPCGRRSGPAAPRPTSVAVLYFDNASRDSSDEYLADGLTEELIGRLSRIERLEVKSRTAVRRFRGRTIDDPGAVARSLTVAHLVSGSVRRSAGRLRVSVELMRAATGVSLWSRTYDRPGSDLLGLEAEIAESVAVSVGGRLAPAERRRLERRPTANAAAYDRFLRANFEAARRTTVSQLRAAREYEEAARLDPRFAPALVAAARMYLALAGNYFDAGIGLSRDSLESLARVLLDRAMQIDPTSADGWLARAYQYYPDWERSGAAFARAAELDPRNAEVHHQYGLFLRIHRSDSAAVHALRRALALEPDRAITLLNLGQTFTVAGQHREAERWMDSALALRPDAPFYYIDAALVKLKLGDTAAARTLALEGGQRGDTTGREDVLAMLEAQGGEVAGARERLARAGAAIARLDCRYSHPCLIHAAALARAGDREAALTLLERVTPRDAWLSYWAQREEFDLLRAEPRFASLMAAPRQ